jgi:hypothetical protein
MKVAMQAAEDILARTIFGVPDHINVEDRRNRHVRSLRDQADSHRSHGGVGGWPYPSNTKEAHPMADQPNVFISHRHEDDPLVGQLKNLLSKNGADVRDSSVTNENPNNATAEDYIKQILADRIKWAGKIIVIISPDTKNHDWVSWEIEYANRYPDKRIIGVWAPGAAGADMPPELDEYADAVVGWNSQAIIDALNGKDNWQGPDGTSVPPRSIKRLAC